MSAWQNFCGIMKNYPQKSDKCLPLLFEMLPTSYEKPQPKSDEDEFADMLREDNEDIKPKRQLCRYGQVSGQFLLFSSVILKPFIYFCFVLNNF